MVFKVLIALFIGIDGNFSAAFAAEAYVKSNCSSSAGSGVPLCEERTKQLSCYCENTFLNVPNCINVEQPLVKGIPTGSALLTAQQSVDANSNAQHCWARPTFYCKELADEECRKIECKDDQGKLDPARSEQEKKNCKIDLEKWAAQARKNWEYFGTNMGAAQQTVAAIEGTGAAQPGALPGQPGAAQPGALPGQPGAQQLAAQQVGAQQLGAQQPGAIPAQPVQPGAPPPGAPPVNGGGGASQGMNPWLAAGIGAVAGGALGFFAGKSIGKEQQKDADQKKQNALARNGTLDCSKNRGDRYRDCDNYFLAQCSQAISAGQALPGNCSLFSQRFCGTSGTDSIVVVTPSDDPPLNPRNDSPPLGGTGEGVGSPFCTNYTAYNFCRTAGRENCPSCQQLQVNSSAACQSNPALCLAQNSPDQLQAARAACPTDPIFATAAGSAGTASAAAAGAGTSLNLTTSSVAARNVASLTAGPAPDVLSANSVSLFTASSLVVQARCAEGRLTNCP